MAARLNGEFVKRLNAVMAIYQALGGDTNLGIESLSGGLRSADDQITLFKKCRRIRVEEHLSESGKLQVQPVGDGSKESDWEEIPQSERTGEGLVSQEIKIDGHGTRGDAEKHGPLQDCGVKWVKQMPNGDVYGHTYGTVTEAWVSWHNLGLAADLTEILVDKKGKVYQNGLASNSAWNRLTATIFGDLGMTWGGWWPWDPDHIEFHPQMPSPRNIGQPGQPLPDSQLRTQYTWKLPATVFDYRVDIDPKQNILWVYTFGTQDDGTITLKALRTIKGEQSGAWDGDWATFDPPIPLFPAYIPTISLHRNSQKHPEDVKFDSDTTVTAYSYIKNYWSDDKPSFDWRKHVGKVHYTLDLKMENRQFEANRAYGMSVAYYKPNRPNPEYDRIRKLWHYLAHTSVYDLRAVLSGDILAMGQQTGRRSDHDGYTEELDMALGASIGNRMGIIEFGWDRDGGKVGSGMVTAREQKGQYLLTEASPMEGGPFTVSDKLPPGAWDMPEPMQEPPANPKPKDKPKPNEGGFFRP
jgi:hypothetical protein